MKRTVGLLVLTIVTIGVFAQGPPRTYEITTFGAKGDGVTDNTAIIQKVIDTLAALGGGRVGIPAGNFVTGVITLRSNVELFVTAGAKLLGSTKRSDYGKSRRASASLLPTTSIILVFVAAAPSMGVAAKWWPMLTAC